MQSKADHIKFAWQTQTSITTTNETSNQYQSAQPSKNWWDMKLSSSTDTNSVTTRFTLSERLTFCLQLYGI